MIDQEQQEDEVVNGKNNPIPAGTPHSSQILAMLLESEDLQSALEANGSLLDGDLLALVKQNALFARQNNEIDLAEGLDGLASYIEDVLAQRAQP